MTLKISANLKQRLWVSLVCITMILVVCYLSYRPAYQLTFITILGVVIGCALWEYYQIAHAKGYRPLVKTGLATTAAYVIVSYLSLYFPQAGVATSVVLGVAFLLGFLYFFFQDKNPLVNLAVTTFGVAYLVIPLTCLLSINYFFYPNGNQDGRWWFLYVLTVTKMTDTGAFAIGKNFGKHQLAAHISPKKTVEGALGGIGVALVTSIVFPFIARYFSPASSMELGLWQSVSLGFLIGILAQIGDLGESLLKRDAGLKDSNQLPGLGGMLDMVDSLIFTTPLVYFFLLIQKMAG